MAQPQTRYAGGCLCGALRYEAFAEPLFMGHCYCTDCQKASGSGFMPFMGFARGALRFTGEVRGHVSKAANGGQARRNFCPSCGSLVFGGEPESSQALNIYAGSLDDSTSFQPSIAIFASSRPHWALIPPGLTTFERMPEDSR